MLCARCVGCSGVQTCLAAGLVHQESPSTALWHTPRTLALQSSAPAPNHRAELPHSACAVGRVCLHQPLKRRHQIPQCALGGRPLISSAPTPSTRLHTCTAVPSLSQPRTPFAPSAAPWGSPLPHRAGRPRGPLCSLLRRSACQCPVTPVHSVRSSHFEHQTETAYKPVILTSSFSPSLLPPHLTYTTFRLRQPGTPPTEGHSHFPVRVHNLLSPIQTTDGNVKWLVGHHLPLSSPQTIPHPLDGGRGNDRHSGSRQSFAAASSPHGLRPRLGTQRSTNHQASRPPGRNTDVAKAPSR